MSLFSPLPDLMSDLLWYTCVCSTWGCIWKTYIKLWRNWSLIQPVICVTKLQKQITLWKNKLYLQKYIKNLWWTFAFDWWLRNNFSLRASVILRLLNFYMTGPPRGSICSQTFFKIGALKNLANFTEKQNWQNFAKFTGKHLYQCLSFNKVACNFIKKETLTQVFFCEFCEISKNTFFLRKTSSGCSYYDSKNNFSLRVSVMLRLLSFCIICLPCGSNCSQMFFKIGALKNFANFTGKHLRWSLF